MINTRNIFAGKKAFSSVVFGTHKFGSAQTDDKTAFELLDKLVELGGNVIDTARCYSGGNSEKVVGRWLKSCGAREKIILCTKGGEPKYTDHGAVGRLLAGELKNDFEKSFDALDTDYVDIYFLHKDDENLCVEEIVETVNELSKSGRVKHFGVSNWRCERIEKANEYARKKGFPVFEFSEVSFSLKHRVTKGWGERALVLETGKKEFEAYKENRMPVLGYTSQAYGFFEINAKKPIEEVEDSDLNKKILSKVNDICKKEGMSPSQVLFGFYNSCGIVNIPVVTTGNTARLENIAKCAGASLADEYVNELLALRFSE